MILFDKQKKSLQKEITEKKTKKKLNFPEKKDIKLHYSLSFSLGTFGHVDGFSSQTRIKQN